MKKFYLLTVVSMCCACAAAENVWTLGKHIRNEGLPITSPDGAITVFLAHSSKADFEAGKIGLAGKDMYGGVSRVRGEGAIDMRGLVIADGERRIDVKELSIGKFFLARKKGITAFYADNVVDIGAHAFARAADLGEVSIKGTADTLPNGSSVMHPSNRIGVFCACTSLTNLVLDLPLKYIGSAAFANCPSLPIDISKIVTESVTNIGDCAFNGARLMRGRLATKSLDYLGARAFCGAGFDEISLGCSDALKSFPRGGSSGGTAYGVFTVMSNLTNLEIRAKGLVEMGDFNFSDSPNLRRFYADAPKLVSLGGTRGCCSGLKRLETIEMNTPVLREVGTSWPPFNATRSLKEVIWHGPPPPLGALKRLFKGMPPVANTAPHGKKCVLRAKGPEWAALASEFEMEESKYAPEGCKGVFFSSSRTAWAMIED